MKTGLIIALIGFALNVLETWYFGWNMEAESVAEKFADNFCMLVMGLGMAMFLVAWAIKLSK